MGDGNAGARPRAKGRAQTWRTVRPLLWGVGHRVFTPSLTGIGERAHVRVDTGKVDTFAADRSEEVSQIP